MTPTVDIAPVGRAVEKAMLDLPSRIREESDYRGKVASGKTLASLRTAVLTAPKYVVGTLTGGDWWKFVGNGRGPGKMPPVGPIESWLASRGLDYSPWAVAKKIAAEGSRDYRLGRTNIFEDSFNAWQDSDAIKDVGMAGAKAFGDAFVQQTKLTFTPSA